MRKLKQNKIKQWNSKNNYKISKKKDFNKKL